MNKLYKLYISLGADKRNNSATKITLYEYSVSSVKNKYIEISINDTKRRIAFDKLNVIQNNTQGIKHISYYVWLDTDNDEVINKYISEIKEKIVNTINEYKETIAIIENNLEKEDVFSKEIVDDRY